jgi:hypothetical protein
MTRKSYSGSERAYEPALFSTAIVNVGRLDACVLTVIEVT